MKNKGFTLIELLVVIAIIGILSSVVFIQVNKATNKAKDSTIKADLSQLRAAAALYHDATNTYSGFCTSDEAKRILNGVKSQYPSTGQDRADCNDKEFEWAACGQLFSTSAAWCVDVSGAAISMSQDDCKNSWASTTCQ